MSAALEAVNDGFHDAYDAERRHAEQDAPVFVVLADMLVVFHGRTRREISFTPPAFHLIKSVAHAPVGLYVLLHREAGTSFGDATTELLVAARARISDAIQSLDGAVSLGPEVISDLRVVLEASRAFAARTTGDLVAVEAFAREIGPMLLRLTRHATRLQLDALDACVDEVLARLDDRGRDALEVVVTGDHQARERSLGMQYFTARLGARHVTYGEGVETEEEALALVGTRRLDAAISRAFFGDATRLQRDVLGDAARDLLAELAPFSGR